MRAQVDVALDERSLADVDEGMNLARFDDQDVSRSGLMVLSVDGPARPTSPPSRTRPCRKDDDAAVVPDPAGVYEVGRNRDVAVLRSYELM